MVARMTEQAPFDFEAALDKADADPKGTAARVLDEAAAQFAAKGFDATTVRSVSSAVGVNVATLHFHWRSKRVLYKAVFMKFERYYRSFLEQTAAEFLQGGVEPPEFVQKFVGWAVDLFCEYPNAPPLLLQQYTSGAGRENENVEMNFDDMELVRGMVAGFFDAEGKGIDIPMVMLTAFYTGVVTFTGSQTQRILLGGDPIEDPEQRERVKRYGTRMLCRLFEIEPPATV